MNQLSSMTPLEIILIALAAVGIFLFFRACWRNIKRSRRHLGLALLTLMMSLTAQTAWATTTSTINVGGTDYTLFTGFTATAGTNASAAAYNYPNLVDGNLDGSSSWHLNNDAQPYYIEFNSADPIIPKGYIFNTYDADNFKPTDWVLKAKADAGDSWTTLSSKSGQSLASGQEFQYACDNNGNNAYKYFRFEVSESSNNIWLTEIRLYGSSLDVWYTHLTVKAATCTETGIKQDCYQRNDGKYFTDETGTTELQESEVIAPMIPHSGDHHDATDVNIEYWQCSMCSKYFSDSGYTTEITEEQTKIYRTITIDDAISGLVTSSVGQALTGNTVTLTVSHLIDTSTLQVNGGNVTLTDEGNGTYTFIVPAADVTVTASILSTYSVTLPANMVIVSATNDADSNGKYISGTVVTFTASFGYAATNVSDGMNTLEPDANGIYTVTVAATDINITATTAESGNTLYLAGATTDFTAVDGNILIGSTSHTVTIANGAKITLSNATISGGIVCDGTAEITLVGTNSVSNTWYSSAGIQIGGSGTTLTIKGDGSLSATGGSQAAGIGLGRTWDANATGGSVVIEGGTVTASGGNGIGTGTVGNNMTATIGDIIIKGGMVNARLGKGTINNGSTATIGAIKIYDTIDKVDASKITESVTYMHDDTDVTASASTYFTIIEDGDRRIIEKKDDTDYSITITDNTEHGTIECAATTAKYGEKVTITATSDFGYRFDHLIVKDADNNDVSSTGNSFFMPKSNVTVSAVFEQGTHGTTEFAWGYAGPEGYVTDATIYDGVTTVNLQQERSYSIIKYSGYSYSKFLLDNDTYNVNIPYAGGTGAFVQNSTSFNNNGEAGYYDITMTDVGNGKWNVSILKTAGQMDVVPDQTYTGSEITPEPLVLAGSLSLTKGTDYVYSYTNNTNVGTATVRATFQGTYAWLGYVEKEFSILPSTVMVSVTGSGTVTCGDKNATSGTSFGVMSEKGASVVLTLAPTDGNAVRSVAYGYTNNSGTTASGLKLPISGTTATLTVPDDLKDGTGVTVTVTFVPALNGGADEASAVALTDATVTDLGGGWYKVENDISFDHTLNLLADTYLTIAEGKTMTVNTTSGKAIDSEYTLNVSGEGALNITTTAGYGIAVCVGNYVQTGATVTASGYIGIRCTDSFGTLGFDNDFTFSGGQLTATGSGGDGIWADNDITLSCTNATDFIQASSYSSGYGAVKIADDQTLVDGNGNIWSGTLSNDEIQSIQNQTLRPVTGVALAKDGSGNISATFDGISLETVNIPVGVTVNSVTLNRTFTPGKASTVMLPFDYTCTGNEGGTFYKFVSMEKENEQWVATMKATGDDTNNVGTLTKNTPYLFLPTATGIAFTIPNEGVTLCTEGGGNCQTADAGSHWTFKGTNSYIKWTSNTADADYTQERADEIGKVYGFAGVQKDGIDLGDFVKAKSGAKIRPMTCYLIWNSTPNNTRGMTRGTDDELPSSIVVRLLSSVGHGNQDDDDNQGGTTAIGTLDTETGEIDFGGWYDMSGRKLSAKPTQKGLYIHNGKKVIIK